jgi:NAD(P)H-hydrate epimerase
VFVIGGSPGLTGAPSMASMAAVRTGSGLVTVALPMGLNSALEAKLTEVMTLPCPETATGSLALSAIDTLLAHERSVDVWAVGPGMGRDDEAQRLALRLVERLPGPLVIDADALFALSGKS